MSTAATPPDSPQIRRLRAAAWALCGLAIVFACKPYAIALINAEMEWAVDNGMPIRVEWMLKFGADPNGRAARGSGPNRAPPIARAVHRGYLKVARVLLRYGASTDARFDGNTTPLMAAAQVGNSDGVRLLIDNGAEVNAVDDQDNTALIVGAGNPEVVRVLLGRGADANLANTFGQTPLLRAAGIPDVDSVRLLVQYGANVNARSARGMTALHRAVLSAPTANGSPRNLGLVPMSLSAFPQIETTTQPDRRKDAAQAVVALLLEHGANANTISAFGATPLMDSVGRPPRIASLLLAHGANPDLLNRSAQTALSLAIQSKSAAVARLLRQYHARE